MENFQVFSFGCSKYTLVGGNKRDVFTEYVLEADGGGQMNGIETFERMPPDQITCKEEGGVVQFHSDTTPFTIDLDSYGRIVHIYMHENDTQH